VPIAAAMEGAFPPPSPGTIGGQGNWEPTGEHSAPPTTTLPAALRGLPEAT
jgi:hypothetical protein